MGEQLTLEEMHLNFSHSCLNPCTFNRNFLYFFWFNGVFMFMELVLMLSVLYNRCREIIFKDLLEAGSQVFLPLLTLGLYSTPTAHCPQTKEIRNRSCVTSVTLYISFVFIVSVDSADIVVVLPSWATELHHNHSLTPPTWKRKGRRKEQLMG